MRTGARVAAMSEEHKQALAEGRTQARVVRAYLEALEQETGGRGRPVDRGRIEERIAELQRRIDGEPDAARRVELIQKRLDEELRLVELDERPDVAALEREFVDVAEAYSQRKGLSYAAWREVGVPAAVLREAGIHRGRGASAA